MYLLTKNKHRWEQRTHYWFGLCSPKTIHEKGALHWLRGVQRLIGSSTQVQCPSVQIQYCRVEDSSVQACLNGEL